MSITQRTAIALHAQVRLAQADVDHARYPGAATVDELRELVTRRDDLLAQAEGRYRAQIGQ